MKRKSERGSISYEEDAKILEAISARYDEKSDEYKILKRAAIALWFSLTKHRQEFTGIIKKWDKGLNAKERAHLISMGIDPDIDPE